MKWHATNDNKCFKSVKTNYYEKYAVLYFEYMQVAGGNLNITEQSQMVPRELVNKELPIRACRVDG